MFYEYQSGNHTRIIDLDNVSWIDLQENDVGMNSNTCIVYTNNGTNLTLYNEEALDFVEKYKAHKNREIYVEQTLEVDVSAMKEQIRNTLRDISAKQKGQ